MPLHIFTYITAGVSTIVNCVLIFLLLRQKPRQKSHIFLGIWLLFFTFFIQVVGSLIIATSNPETALFLYQFGGSFAGLIGFFYIFVREYLKIKKEKPLVFLVFVCAITFFISFFIKRDFFISGVEWDANVQFYLFKAGSGAILIAPFVFFFWGFAIWKLFKGYQKSRSPIERNRLKYLILGGLSPFIGIILVLIPFAAVRRYPFDVFGIALSTICLTYGILRYKLLDINVIIRKGLLYSIFNRLSHWHLSFICAFTAILVSGARSARFFSSNHFHCIYCCFDFPTITNKHSIFY